MHIVVRVNAHIAAQLSVRAERYRLPLLQIAEKDFLRHRNYRVLTAVYAIYIAMHDEFLRLVAEAGSVNLKLIIIQIIKRSGHP